MNWSQLFGGLIVVFAFWWMFRASRRDEELRRMRLPAALSLVVLAALVWFTSVTHSPIVIGLLFLLARPLLTIFAYFWSHFFADQIAQGVGAIVHGAEDSRPSLNRAQLAAARRHRAAGEVWPAIRLVEKELEAEPENADALFLLASLYGEDLRVLHKAREIVQRIQQSGIIGPDMKAMAERRLEEWRANAGQKPPEPGLVFQAMPTNPVSSPEGLAVAHARQELDAGHMGTAVEILESALKTEPEDFETLMLLATVYVERCREFQRGEKIIERIVRAPKIRQEDKDFAQAQFQVWKVREYKLDE